MGAEGLESPDIFHAIPASGIELPGLIIGGVCSCLGFASSRHSNWHGLTGHGERRMTCSENEGLAVLHAGWEFVPSGSVHPDWVMLATLNRARLSSAPDYGVLTAEA